MNGDLTETVKYTPPSCRKTSSPMENRVIKAVHSSSTTLRLRHHQSTSAHPVALNVVYEAEQADRASRGRPSGAVHRCQHQEDEELGVVLQNVLQKSASAVVMQITFDENMISTTGIVVAAR